MKIKIIGNYNSIEPAPGADVFMTEHTIPAATAAALMAHLHAEARKPQDETRMIRLDDQTCRLLGWGVEFFTSEELDGLLTIRIGPL